MNAEQNVDRDADQDVSQDVHHDSGQQVDPNPELALRTSTLRQGLEAVLFLADEPVDVPTLAEFLQVDTDEVEKEIQGLAQEYEQGRRGIEIRQAGGGWRMYTADLARDVVERWALIGRSGRLTQAALETLAVIAYKQPISRQHISDIRGVNADGAVRSLVARGFVMEVGRDEGVGQAVLYGTTSTLLERLGLQDLDELPPLTDFLPEAPAPDEPELGALKEIRKRLAAGGELKTRAGLRDRAAAATGSSLDEEDRDDHLPPPRRDHDRSGHEQMDELTDRLERAARNAVDRLRLAVAAGDGGTDDPTPDERPVVADGDGDDVATGEHDSMSSGEQDSMSSGGSDEGRDGR